VPARQEHQTTRSGGVESCHIQNGHTTTAVVYKLHRPKHCDETRKCADVQGQAAEAVYDRSKTKMKRVPRPGDNVHIPLYEREALRLLLKVKPTAEMPRSGTKATKAKRKPTKKAK